MSNIGNPLQIQGFKQYVEQYTKDITGPTGEPAKVVYESVSFYGGDWPVCVVIKSDALGFFSSLEKGQELSLYGGLYAFFSERPN